MDIEQLLTTTRSARKTLDLSQPIDMGEVRECIGTGLQAPNGSNNQSWKWLLVQDAELRRKIAELYKQARITMTGKEDISEWIDASTDTGRVLSSAEWLVQNMADVPLLVIPCFEGYMSRKRGSESFHQATIYGSIFPAVWNFQLALHTKGYGTCLTTLHLNYEAEVRDLLGIPESYVQGCLLPVARLKPGTTFKPAPRRPLDEVIAIDSWE